MKRGKGVYLFYRLDQIPASVPAASAKTDFRIDLWTPSLRHAWPRGARSDQAGHFLFRTMLHVMRIFSSRQSGALLIYDGEKVAHYSAFTPRYWRFPFLTPKDIQIGDTWTEPEYRGRGLAKLALRQLLGRLQMPGRQIWYVVDETNRSSIRVAEDCGFRLAGVGTRIQRMRAFDYYQMLEGNGA